MTTETLREALEYARDTFDEIEADCRKDHPDVASDAKHAAYKMREALAADPGEALRDAFVAGWYASPGLGMPTTVDAIAEMAKQAHAEAERRYPRLPAPATTASAPESPPSYEEWPVEPAPEPDKCHWFESKDDDSYLSTCDAVWKKQLDFAVEKAVLDGEPCKKCGKPMELIAFKEPAPEPKETP